MKVLVPLSKMEYARDYIKSGAEEFYFGFYDEQWVKVFGEYADINRLTGFKKEANPYNFDEALTMIQELKKKKVSVYVTFNSSMYSEKQLEYIDNYLNQLKETKLDGVIVSCLELVELANKHDIPSVVSTISGVYNEDIARVYAQKGAKRLILPRDLSLQEIEDIVQAVPEVEYEVFMMRNGCMFSDSNCLGMHRLEQCSFCSSIRKASHIITTEATNFEDKHKIGSNHEMYHHTFHKLSCGLCAIYRFVQLGIAAAKIVGRSDECLEICRDIYGVYENIKIAESCKSEEEYLDRMLFLDSSTASCRMGLSCYYPEVRF